MSSILVWWAMEIAVGFVLVWWAMEIAVGSVIAPDIGADISVLRTDRLGLPPNQFLSAVKIPMYRNNAQYHKSNWVK